MITLGYNLSSEEQPAADLVRYAQMAQDTGFAFALISDHFHPWTDRQGQSPFAWSVLGAIAQATQRLGRVAVHDGAGVHGRGREVGHHAEPLRHEPVGR